MNMTAAAKKISRRPSSDGCWHVWFSNWLYPMKGDAVPALRVTCQGSLTVLIIDTQGYDYPRYVGFEIETE